MDNLTHCGINRYEISVSIIYIIKHKRALSLTLSINVKLDVTAYTAAITLDAYS